MADIIEVKITFPLTIDGKSYGYDSLYYPFDKYPSIKPSDIDNAKQTRITAWDYAIKHPPVVPEIPKEVQIAEIDAQIAELQARKIAIQAIAIEEVPIGSGGGVLGG